MYPKDRHKVEFKPGTLFVEGHMGDKIWNGEATIIHPPIGVFTGVRADPPDILGGWIVDNYMEGNIVEQNGKFGKLNISRWDGEFMGDWNDTLIIGEIKENGLIYIKELKGE